MQILQAVHLNLIEMIQRLAGGEPRRESRVVRHPTIHSFTANGIRFPDGLLAFGRVHDQIDLVVLDHVHDVWPSLANFVNATTDNARLSQRSCRPLRGEYLEAFLDEPTRKHHRPGFIAVTHTDEAYAVARQGHARSGLGLGISLTEGSPRAHHFARGLHL